MKGEGREGKGEEQEEGQKSKFLCFVIANLYYSSGQNLFQRVYLSHKFKASPESFKNFGLTKQSTPNVLSAFDFLLFQLHWKAVL